MRDNLLQVTDYFKIKTVIAVQKNTVTKIKHCFQICLLLQYFKQIYSLIEILSWNHYSHN